MPQSSVIAYDATSFIIHGEKVFLHSGSLHYFRVPPDQWRQRFQLMKQAGINTICSYVPWNFYEPEKGKFTNWSGQRNLAGYVRLAEEMGFYFILRPGPFIHAEWRNGGLPDWLIAEGITVVNRANQPNYLSAVRRWFEAVFNQVRDLQITRGGPIILIQVDNEYGQDWNGKDGGIEYLNHLRDMIRELGMDVPLIDMNLVEETLASDDFIRAIGAYPINSWMREKRFQPISLKQSFIKVLQPSQPLIAIETQGAMFVAQNSSQKPVLPVHIPEYLFWSFLAKGVGGINWHTFAGGTNPPGYQETASDMHWESGLSYDAQSIVREYGQVSDRYGATKRLGWLSESFNAFFAASEPDENLVESVSPDYVEATARSDGESAFIIVRNYATDCSADEQDALKIMTAVMAGEDPAESTARKTPSGKPPDSYNPFEAVVAEDVKIRVRQATRGVLTFPRYTCYNLPGNRVVGLPFNLPLNPEVRVEYATAEVLTVRDYPERRLVLLYGDVDQEVELALRIPCEASCDLIGNVKCLENSLQKGHRGCIFSAIAGEFPTIVLNTITVTQITFLTRWQAEHCWNVEISMGEMVGIFSMPLIAGNYEATGLPGSCLTEELTLFLPDKPTGFPEESLWDSQRSIGHYPVQIKFPSLQSSTQQSKEGNWHIREITLTPKDFSGVDDILIRVRTSSEEAYSYINGRLVSDSFIPSPLYAWEFKVLQAIGAHTQEKPIEVLVKAKETETFEVQVLCVVSGKIKEPDWMKKNSTKISA